MSTARSEPLGAFLVQYLLLAIEGYNNLADIADLVLESIRNINVFIVIFCLRLMWMP
jgi:hypothetical protein